jgi:hypothetical protein
MLAVLYAKAATGGIADIQARVSRQDMRDFHYAKKFDAIIIPARSFLHLTEQKDQLACLKAVRAHLNPGGRLLLNFFNPDLELIVARIQPAAEYESLRTFTHPASGEPVELSFWQINDIPNQVQNITWQFKSGSAVYETSMALRWIYKEEFPLLLRLAGFDTWQLYGGLDKSEFSGDSRELVWIVK